MHSTDAPAVANTSGVGPSGIGGWLVLPALGLVVTPLMILYQLYTNFLPLANADSWSAMIDRQSPIYHPLLVPLIIWEIGMNVVLLAVTIYAAILFFRRSKRAPVWVIMWLILSLGIMLIDAAVGSQIPVIAKEGFRDSLRDLGRSITGAAVWIPYFLLSKRVKSTFVEDK